MLLARFIRATVATLLLGLAIAVGATAYAQTSPLSGIWVLNGIKKTSLDSTMLGATNVTGISIITNWGALEPNENSYNWSMLDNEVAQAAAAGKLASIVVEAGFNAPAWVYNDGAKSVKFVWDLASWGPPICSVQQVPVPWDPVFLSKWHNFVSAFGARYNNNPTVASVKITGLNSKTGEIFLQTSVNENINQGQCTGYNDVANWQAAGYTRVNVEFAWARILQDYQRFFPNKPLAAQMVPGGFPPLDDNGVPISGQTTDPQAAADLVSSAVTTLGTQFVLQNDGLSATWVWQLEKSYDTTLTTGYQTVNVMGSALPATVTQAENAQGHYLEIYEQDLTNASLMPTITAANSAM